MRTPHFSILAASAACLTVTACTGGSVTSGGDEGDEGGTTKDTKSIKWLIEDPEDATALKQLQQHVQDDFTEKTGITVKISTLDFQNVRTVLIPQLRSGKGPDVFSWGSGPSFGGALADAGLLTDLTDAYAEHDWQVYDFAKERVTDSEGRLYAIPGEMETIGLFFNKDLFDKEGLEEPQSLDELVAVAEKLKAAGKTPLAVSDKEGWEGGHLLSMALSSAVGSERMEALINGEESWESPEVVAALQFWQDMNERGMLPESPTAVDYDTAIATFFAGKSAMLPTGSWLVGEIDDNKKFNEVGYIPFPAPDGPGIFTGGLGSGPMISKASPNQESAVKFLDFLASPEHGQWTVENLHTIPPQPIDTEGLDVSPLLAQVLDTTAEVSEGGDFGHNIDVLATEAFNEAMWNGVQAIFTGQKTAEEVAAELEAASKK